MQPFKLIYENGRVEVLMKTNSSPLGIHHLNVAYEETTSVYTKKKKKSLHIIHCLPFIKIIERKT